MNELRKVDFVKIMNSGQAPQALRHAGRYVPEQYATCQYDQPTSLSTGHETLLVKLLQSTL